MTKLKTIFVCALMVLMTTSTAIAYDDAAANLDAGDTSAWADEVPSLAVWYDGDLSDNDVFDHYFWDDSLSNDMHIIIVSGSTDVAYKHTMPSGHSDSLSLGPNSFSVRQLFVQNNTTSLDFYFSQAEQGVNVYCFALFDQASSQYDWNALNQSSSQCDSNSTAPSVNVVGTDLGGGDYLEGGDLIEIDITYTGYISGYTVYWYDENLGELTEIDYTDVVGANRSSSVITVEALNYDSGGDLASVIVCPSGKLSSEPQDPEGPCDKSSPIAVRPKASVVFDCSMFNNMGGPNYMAGAQYMSGDIVEFPQGSMEFWYSTVDFNQKSPSMSNDWIGPCNCTELGYGNIWSSSTTYPGHTVVEYNGGIWISIDVTSEEPNPVGGPVSNQWIFCTNLTAPSYDDTCGSGYDGALDYARPSGGMNLGSGGPAWDMTMGTVQDQIYEYPAGSGVFWIARHNLNPGTAQEPGVGSNWGEYWLGSCNCSEIWTATGGQHYYPQGGFAQYTILEYPQNSGVLWISLSDSSVTDSLAPQEGTDSWRLCYSGTSGGGGNTGNNLCDKFNGFGGPVFGIGSDVQNGGIYEYPSASGIFYMAVQSYTNLQITPDSSNGHEVWEGPCNCTEIWSSTMTQYSPPPTTFGEFEIVSYNSQLYISLIPNNQLPLNSIEGWRLCETNTNTDGDCRELADGFAGPFYNQNQFSYQMGDVVEFPAGSGNYYVSMHDGNTAHPTDSEYRWKPCSCEDLWDGTTWQPYTHYDTWKIVEHNGKLYVKKSTFFIWVLGDPEPGLNTGMSKYHWRSCDPGYCEPVGVWNQNDANNGMYDQGVVVWSYWMGGKRISSINDNPNSPSSGSLNNGWSYCIFKPPIKLYPEPVAPPVEGPGEFVKNRTYGKLLAGSDDSLVLSTLDLQEGDSGNNFPENCWFDNDGLTDWSDECTDTQRENPATFTKQMPPVVTGMCDVTGLESSNAVLMDSYSEQSRSNDPDGFMKLGDIKGEFMPHECGAVLLLSEESFPNGEWEPVEQESGATQGRHYFTVYPVATYDSWWDCVFATIWSGERCYGPVGDMMVTGDGDLDVESLPSSTYEVWISEDGEAKTKYYAMNMIGKTCDMFELNDETQCYDNVVVEATKKNTTVDEPLDSDNDGVIDEWDKCPETPEDTATDKEGCAVDIKEVAEESGLPGFTAVSALVAITMAVAFLRRRIDLEEI